MDRFERIYRLHTIFSNRRTPISRVDLQDKLDGCSLATLKRTLSDARNFLNVPISYDRERQGYYLDNQGEGKSELPGLWFNSAEIHALLTSHRLLTEVKPGLLEPYLAPLKDRLEALLKHKHAGDNAIFERVRILPMAAREARLEDFQKITDALVKRLQLRIQYSSRGKDELSERWISPQRLVYYRDNWYLDAWCHSRKALRTFSVDRLNVAEAGTKARDISQRQLDQHFTASYGIFAGLAKHSAVIRFSSTAARWVADEQWHPQQTSTVLPDGSVELTVPYGDPTELIMDILKYGADTEVISPPALRHLVEEKLSRALRQYRNIRESKKR